MSGPINFVVVPDGLAADQDGRALPVPSFVYRAALDWTAAHATLDDRVYLAPANRFGGDVTEQEAGSGYLRTRTRAAILAAPSDEAGYIDTRGNARLLRRELERTGAWPLHQVHLVAYTAHLARAVVAFTQEGFVVDRACAAVTARIDRADPGTRIVRRLWYYRYPAAHRAYERMALGLTTLRLI